MQINRLLNLLLYYVSISLITKTKSSFYLVQAKMQLCLILICNILIVNVFVSVSEFYSSLWSLAVVRRWRWNSTDTQHRGSQFWYSSVARGARWTPRNTLPLSSRVTWIDHDMQTGNLIFLWANYPNHTAITNTLSSIVMMAVFPHNRIVQSPGAK